MIKEVDMDVSLHKRIPLIYIPARNVIKTMYDLTSTIHTDIPQATLDAMHSDIPKIYVGVHKSLWEAMGVPVVIYQQGAQVPYVVIGKNLVKGISKPFMKALGCIYVERKAKDDKLQDRYSALEIKNKITLGLDRSCDILMFPTDGRTKDGLTNSFYSTPFDAAITHLKNGPAYIIPVDVDYERVNDMPRMLKCIEKGKSYTFRIWHFPEWWKNLGDIYVNFADPILVDEKTNRKKINFYTLEQALNTTKILPVNVYAKAALELWEKGLKESELPHAIDSIIERLLPHEHKFRGFKNSEDVIKHSGLSFNNSLREHGIYANYISQYF